MKKGSNIILWCDGLKKSTDENNKGAKLSDSSEDDEGIQETVKQKRKRAKKTDEENGETRKKRKKGEDKDKEVQTTINHLTGKQCGTRGL